MYGMTGARSRYGCGLFLCAAMVVGAGCRESNPSYKRGLADGPPATGGTTGGTGSGGVGSVGVGSGGVGGTAGIGQSGGTGGGGLPADAAADRPPDGPVDHAAADARPDSLNPPPVDITTGLVGYWPLDEGMGNSFINDRSGNNNHGGVAVLDLATAWTPGKVGRALEIPDVMGGAVVVQRTASIDSINSGLTIAAWVYRNAGIRDRHHAVLSRQLGGASREFYNLAFHNDALIVWLYAESPAPTISVRATTGTAPLMTWIHVAVTWDGSTVRLYQDGAEVGTGPFTARMPAGTTPVLLGSNANNAIVNQPLLGRLDEVRLYNRALPREAILALIAGAGQ